MRVLIIDEMPKKAYKQMLRLDVHTDYLPKITPEKVFEIIENYEGLIVRSKMKIDKALIHKGCKLKFVARAGAGLDQIDLETLIKKDVKIISSPEGNRDAVAEHSIGLLLALSRKINILDREVRLKKWEREHNRGFEIYGKTVGIIGFGKMGSAFAQRLRGFGCEILAFDREHNITVPDYVQRASLEELHEKADIVSLHFPLDDDNRFLVDEEYLTAFKKPYYLLNTARGEILDLSGLIRCLKNGQVLGAGLDVMENENPETLTEKQAKDFRFLSQADNVILTPHIAGLTMESKVKVFSVLIEKIRDQFNIQYQEH